MAEEAPGPEDRGVALTHLSGDKVQRDAHGTGPSHMIFSPHTTVGTLDLRPLLILPHPTPTPPNTLSQVHTCTTQPLTHRHHDDITDGCSDITQAWW